MKKILSAVLVLCMLFSVFALAGCQDPQDEKKADSYTYYSYTTALGTNWNPHTWETNADDGILGYLSSPFCTMSIKDSVKGEYQWVYEMATSITDVTKTNQGDLTKYNVDLQEGKTAETTEDGYVFEIKLNPNAKWEDGTKITADDYIYSMEQLLSSKMRNYRSNLYWFGESAVAGGNAFYNSEAPIYAPIVPAYDKTPDYSYDVDKAIADGNLYINVTTESMTLYNLSLTQLNNDYLKDQSVADTFKKLGNEANPYGYTLITNENKDEIYTALTKLFVIFSINDAEEAKEVAKETFFYNTGEFGDKVEYDAVGCYKVDEYTIRYVTQYHIELNYFLTSCTRTWLVHKATYEAGKDTTGELVTTDYGTSKATSMSYGPYKIASLQDGKQLVFVQNENWYGYEKKEDGTLVSYTNFLVDGEKRQQYQTTRVVIDVMDEATAKQKFLKGELSEWSPSADELITYNASEQLYKVDETYTMSFFFNTDVNALKTMDSSKGNTNSVVLSNTNFRKAMSLAIDRAKFVTATAGYKPAYAIMNNLYFYDVYNDPTSSYRSSDEAMQAICNLYGVEYGEGKAYATLKEAYDSITGYNLTEAKALMKTACDELKAANLYTSGNIKIRIGWAKGALESSDQKLVTLLNEMVNAALVDSGFGTIEFEAVGNINDRYGDVPKGEFAIGYGAWGGAAFYPFRNFQVYMDPDNTDINEAACWDPTTEKWTLTVNGAEDTMTCQEWANCMIGNGKYATADFDVKLSITAQLEEMYLKKYYRIPLCGSTACFMMSYQVKYYTDTYNIMYDFGGFRLMSYNYTDAEWATYCSQQNGQLNYE